LRKRGNLLLCAILLGNVAVNSLLSILMANMSSGLMGFITSTAMIVVFGEIVPQAICTRHGLAAGAYLAWLLWIVIALTCIISLPIAALLDVVLGEEVGVVYTKARLARLF
jgi:metal transporter CNNM